MLLLCNKLPAEKPLSAVGGPLVVVPFVALPN